MGRDKDELEQLLILGVGELEGGGLSLGYEGAARKSWGGEGEKEGGGREREREGEGERDRKK